MKQFTFVFLILLFFSACKDSSEKTSTPTATKTPAINLTKYPKALQKIFAKHGSLEQWNKMNAMSFQMVNEDGTTEEHFIDLKNRREKIKGSDFITGYDGKEFWLEADTSYKGNAVFYHNLIFYFYAMPFVVADEGINYTEADSLVFKDKSYPGIKISYNAEVGISPEDEYFIYYDSETYQMTWLAYTVTYFSKAKSKKLGWINYNDWKDFNGLLLPNSMEWYKTEENKPIKIAKKRQFNKIVVSETPFKDELFAKTGKAVIVE